MTVKDLKYYDIIELYSDREFTYILNDEFDINIKDNTFVKDEDDDYKSFDFISKVWREDKAGNYILIYNKDLGS